MATAGSIQGESEMTTRQVVKWAVLGVALLLSIPCGILVLWGAAAGGSDKGSPELAVKWEAELRPYKTPEEAASRNKDVVVVRFEDGDWVFGLCKSSHGIWKRGGGTVVVKDSRGRIRAFFGHVCGEGALGALWEKSSLDAYYRTTLAREGGFVEFRLP